MIRDGAYLPHPYDRCPTGEHVGAIVAEVDAFTITIDRPPRYVCGCTDPRRPGERAVSRMSGGGGG